jgi:hypothetical protein
MDMREHSARELLYLYCLGEGPQSMHKGWGIWPLHAIVPLWAIWYLFWYLLPKSYRNLTSLLPLRGLALLYSP